MRVLIVLFIIFLSACEVDKERNIQSDSKDLKSNKSNKKSYELIKQDTSLYFDGNTYFISKQYVLSESLKDTMVKISVKDAAMSTFIFLERNHKLVLYCKEVFNNDSLIIISYINPKKIVYDITKIDKSVFAKLLSIPFDMYYPLKRGISYSYSNKSLIYQMIEYNDNWIGKYSFDTIQNSYNNIYLDISTVEKTNLVVPGIDYNWK